MRGAIGGVGQRALLDDLVSRRRPVKVAELTAHFGINRATIYRMLRELEAELDTPVRRSSEGIWINAADYQMSVRLTLNVPLEQFANQ